MRFPRPLRKRRRPEYDGAPLAQPDYAHRPPLEKCTLPPAGWHCNLRAGHAGPCPAHPDEPRICRDPGRFGLCVRDLDHDGRHRDAGGRSWL